MTTTNQTPNLDGLVQASKNISTQIGALIQAVNAFFPQASVTISTTATGGSATLPANPDAFMNVSIDGTAYKVPLYLP